MFDQIDCEGGPILISYHIVVQIFAFFRLFRDLHALSQGPT